MYIEAQLFYVGKIKLGVSAELSALNLFFCMYEFKINI